MNYPKISIIIPTFHSEKVIETCLKGINKQDYPKQKIEVIIADNYSKDNTLKIAKKYKTKICLQKGIPPQVCQQRNLGALKAHGEYLMFLDHDMELSPRVLKNFADLNHKADYKIDAWHIPERVVSHNWILGQVRTFEKDAYGNTPIGAVRIIKKQSFMKTPEKYDPSLSSTNADWDMDNQLKLLKFKISSINEPIYHHEENLRFWEYINKKANYMHTVDLYRQKWASKDNRIYNSIVKKQYDPLYRLIGVFFENGKWKKTVLNLHLYLLFILITFLTILFYYFKNFKKAYATT